MFPASEQWVSLRCAPCTRLVTNRMKGGRMPQEWVIESTEMRIKPAPTI
jgi:hypothetical protein